MVIDPSVKRVPGCVRALRRRHAVVANLEIYRAQRSTVETHERVHATVTAAAGIRWCYCRKRPAYLDIDNCYWRELASRQTKFAVVPPIGCSVPTRAATMHPKSVSAGAPSQVSLLTCGSPDAIFDAEGVSAIVPGQWRESRTRRV